MIGAVLALLLCQLAGEALARFLGLPVPGPVIGLVLMVGALALRGRLRPEAAPVDTTPLGTVAGVLLANLSEAIKLLNPDDPTIRPIAGTRPRGKTASEDEANRASLLADPKERAEHLMLLDLGRNDVGRVSEAGSVSVTDSYTVEFYSHVMHIVSNVVGRLDPAHDAIDAILAGFPAGTVSGAPKVRACEVIAELEPEKRGVYAGGVGYFSPDGSMDSCIVLRTALVKDGVMHVQAGAGIVADSDPAYEQRECEAKSGALLAAAREAIAQASDAGFGQ